MEQPGDLLKARLAKFPPPTPSSSVKEDIQDDTTDTSTETDSSTASIQTIVPTTATPDDDSTTLSTDFAVPTPPKLFARPSDPVSWTKYFRENIKVASSTDSSITFNVYYSPPMTDTAPVYIFHHGAGSSGLSFALVAAHLTTAISCGVIAYDVRYHGSTVVNDRSDWNLSLETLAQDQVDIVNGVSKNASWDSRNEGWPDLILVGHSLGGAVSAHIAANSLLPTLCLCVIDVVEGSAMDALQSMQTYLSSRPRTFKSLEQGIQWHIHSRTIRNRESARVSVPPLLLQTGNEWIWRTDLAKTRPFWEDWFKGLSGKFLGSRAGKLLLLAGTDRLDKPLMIGQMQGKYQLLVFSDAGHFLHEDMPSRTADALIELWRRNDREAIKRVALLNRQKALPNV